MGSIKRYGGVRPETRAMKRRKIARRLERASLKKTPNKLGIPPKANLLRKQIREALSMVGSE
jgi:hypothetical protein